MSQAKKVAQQKIESFHDQVGMVPDRVIAERAGVSLSSVRNYRLSHGIAAAGLRKAIDKQDAKAEYLPPEPEEASEQAEGVKRPRSKVEPFKHLLGTVPDRVIAERANVGVNTVHAYRKRHGIIAAGRRKSVARKAAAEAAQTTMAPSVAAPVPRSNGVEYVWQVIFRESEEVAFVVASGLVEAASKAETSTNDVLGVEKVGRVL